MYKSAYLYCTHISVTKLLVGLEEMIRFWVENHYSLFFKNKIFLLAFLNNPCSSSMSILYLFLKLDILTQWITLTQFLVKNNLAKKGFITHYFHHFIIFIYKSLFVCLFTYFDNTASLVGNFLYWHFCTKVISKIVDELKMKL